MLLTVFFSSSVFASEFDKTMALAKKGDPKAQSNLGVMYA